MFSCTEQHRLTYKLSSLTILDSTTSCGSQSYMSLVLDTIIPRKVQQREKASFVLLISMNPRWRRETSQCNLAERTSIYLHLQARTRCGGAWINFLPKNVVTHVLVRHRRPGHPSERSLDVINTTDGNGGAFGGCFTDCGVIAAGKSHQLDHCQHAYHAAVDVPFNLLHGHLMGPISPIAHGGYKFLIIITNRSPSGLQSTFSAAKRKASPRLSCSSLLPQYVKIRSQKACK